MTFHGMYSSLVMALEERQNEIKVDSLRFEYRNTYIPSELRGGPEPLEIFPCGVEGGNVWSVDSAMRNLRYDSASNRKCYDSDYMHNYNIVEFDEDLSRRIWSRLKHEFMSCGSD